MWVAEESNDFATQLGSRKKERHSLGPALLSVTGAQGPELWAKQ